MPTDAASLKSALLSLLADVGQTDGWETALLNEALGQGLADANRWLAPVESSVTTVIGREQDIATLAAGEVVAVAFPWTDDSSFRDAVVAWRLVGPGKLWLEGKRPAAGETVRVRFRKRYTVNGLGGAVATTLPVESERLLLVAAAAQAYWMRYRQLARRPSSAPSDVAACKDLAAEYSKQFEQLAAVGPSGPGPSWPQMGL